VQSLLDGGDREPLELRRAEHIAPNTPPGPQQSAIDLAAVANPHHQDHQLAALPLVDNAIGANPQTPQTLEFAFESRPCQECR
jgi:hypothetical protein